MPQALVKDLMSEGYKSVSPDEPIVEAVALMTNNSLHHLAVIDKSGDIAGILTEREMVTKDSYLHLLTLVKLLNKVPFYKTDDKLIRDDVKKLVEAKVRDFMNTSPPTIKPDATVEEATRLLGEPKNNPLFVAEGKKLLGVLSLSDLTKLYGISAKSSFTQGEVNVDNFIKNFEKKFVFVSKTRTRWWLIVSMLFAAIGFIVAWSLIIRVNIE